MPTPDPSTVMPTWLVIMLAVFTPLNTLFVAVVPMILDSFKAKRDEARYNQERLAADTARAAEIKAATIARLDQAATAFFNLFTAFRHSDTNTVPRVNQTEAEGDFSALLIALQNRFNAWETAILELLLPPDREQVRKLRATFYDLATTPRESDLNPYAETHRGLTDEITYLWQKAAGRR